MSNMFTLPGIKASRISAPVSTGSTGGTADWSGLGRGIAEAGEGIAAGIQASKTNLQIVEGQLEKGNQPMDKLQGRIDKAKAEGKDAKAAWLEGRKERRDIRDEARAERITQRNIERKEQTQARQDRKNERFYERREDGNVPISSFGQAIEGVARIFQKNDDPINMKMSAKQYADQQKFSKIAKDI
jgi:hypothetical protein